MINSIVDKDSATQTTTRGTFVEFLQSKYEPIQVDDACVTRMEKAGHMTLPLRWRDFLDTSITEKELKTAVTELACTKIPGRDDICLEFF